MFALRRPGDPIIESLIDADFYIATMQQFIRRYYPGMRVRFGLRNRSNVRLGQFIREGELREQLDAVRELRVSSSETHFLAGTYEYDTDENGLRMFNRGFTDWYGQLQLPGYELEYLPDGHIRLEFGGGDDVWEESLHWETIALSIITQLYFEALMRKRTRFERDAIYARGIRLLEEKIRFVRAAVAEGREDFTFAEFGTRRRAFREWQRYVDEAFAAELPGHYLGTSNMYNAMVCGHLPMGTSAHQLPMVCVALAYPNGPQAMRRASEEVYERWWQLYGYGLSIALPDTFGSKSGLEDLGGFGARHWKGSRQDSGNPERYVDRKIDWYLRHGVDPRDKLVIPSDGLTFPRAIEIFDYRRGEIRKSPALGTNATNDFGDELPSALSIVIKPIEANGNPCVKRSDNPAKTQGDHEVIARYDEAFGYEPGEYTECRY